MKTILIVDPANYKPYKPSTLETEALGGTEATVIRVARGLSKYCDVVVAQRGRNGLAFDGDNVSYLGIDSHRVRWRYDAVIVLRDYLVAAEMAAVHKNTPVYLWCHDLAGQADLRFGSPTAVMGIEVVAVSEFHKQDLQEKYRASGNESMPKVHVIYNPIDDDLDKDDTVVDKNKLVFFSSPHKGLEYTLEVFQAALSFNSEFKLHISNPGYYKDLDSLQYKSTINHGPLPHHKAIEHVRSALCVFYPNYVYPETFGLVYAEANAVGTPVLTHRHGAASEVLADSRQFVDVRDKKSLIDTLMKWYHGDRTKVMGQEKFRLSNIALKWKDLLKL